VQRCRVRKIAEATVMFIASHCMLYFERLCYYFHTKGGALKSKLLPFLENLLNAETRKASKKIASFVVAKRYFSTANKCTFLTMICST
ncbi:MAG: hypothetical protein ACREBW_01365, partial [Candidatus Micrarchaeaceae archaeon]